MEEKEHQMVLMETYIKYLVINQAEVHEFIFSRMNGLAAVFYSFLKLKISGEVRSVHAGTLFPLTIQ